MTLTSKGYAGFWKRFGAMLIDGIIVSAALWFISMLLGSDATTNDGASSAARTVVSWLYFALFESSDKQATPGKILLGIHVTDEIGRRITFARATGRHFAKILSGVILGIGFLMAAFTQRKQALHDLIAKTLVVNS